MKHFPQLAVAILLTGCALTPQDREAAHQNQLAKQARENFIAMKQQEHPGQAVVLHDEATPAPQPRKLAMFGGQPATTPAPRGRASTAPTAQFIPTSYQPATPQPRGPRRADDTVYYWQVQAAHQRTTPRQQAAEARYARELAKRPEDLTPDERMWAHEHY